MIMIIMMYDMIVKVVIVVDAAGDENGWCRRISTVQFKIACIFLESCLNFIKHFLVDFVEVCNPRRLQPSKIRPR